MSIDPPKSLPAVPESLLPREHSLYRPRHSSRQRTALTLAVIFFCTPVLLLVVGVRPAEFENRKLAAFPSITDGWGFFTGLSPWASDHVPLRDKAVAAADGISRGVFGEAPKFDRPQDAVGPVQAPKDPSVDRPDPTAFVEVIEGKDDWLFLGDDVEGACEPLVPVAEVHARLARLRKAVESSGRRFVLVIAPNKSTMVPDYLPSKYYGKDCHAKARDAFWNGLAAKTGALDLRTRIRDVAEEQGRQPYPRYDSHWNHDGSLVMARAITEAVKPGTTKTWKVEATKVVDREGDLAPLVGRVAKDPVQSYDLAPDGTTVRSHEIKPDPKAQRFTQPAAKGVVSAKVGMLGDSFAYYAAQYTVACFTDLTLVHVERLTEEARQVARDLAANDVVILEAAERLLVSGVNPVLSTQVIDIIAEEMARQPR